MSAYRYAQKTKVPADRTQAEINQLLEKHGATGFLSGTSGGHAMVAFEMRDRRLKFTMPIPTAKRSDQEAKAKAETRRRWRALLLVLKAKLEAVASNIVEFDVEFLPFVVVRNGETVADQLVPQLAGILSDGKGLPPLLGPGT